MPNSVVARNVPDTALLARSTYLRSVKVDDAGSRMDDAGVAQNCIEAAQYCAETAQLLTRQTVRPMIIPFDSDRGRGRQPPPCARRSIFFRETC